MALRARSWCKTGTESDWTCDQIQLALEYRPPIGRMIGSSQSFEDKERREEGSDPVTALSLESSVSGPRTLVIKTSQTLHREPTKRVTIATVTSQHRSVESDGGTDWRIFLVFSQLHHRPQEVPLGAPCRKLAFGNNSVPFHDLKTLAFKTSQNLVHREQVPGRTFSLDAASKAATAASSRSTISCSAELHQGHVLRDGSAVPCFVMHQGSERTVVCVAMDAVAGARRTPGRHKTGGVPPKPPATLLLSVPCNVLGLRFIVSRRRGVLEAVCRGSGTNSDGFCLIGARCLFGVAASLSPTQAIPTLRRHSVCSCGTDNDSSSVSAHTSRFSSRFPQRSRTEVGFLAEIAAYIFSSHGVVEKLRKCSVEFTEELRKLETPPVLSNCLHKSAFQNASLSK